MKTDLFTIGALELLLGIIFMMISWVILRVMWLWARHRQLSDEGPHLTLTIDEHPDRTKKEHQ